MKVCRALLICFFQLFLSTGLFAQNLFTEKIEICGDAQYCMDCGSPKANCDPFALYYIADKINRKYIFKDGAGTINFQVLVDSVGFSCVLSHSDVTHSPLTDDLIRYLNGVIWNPARKSGRKVNASVNVSFTIANGRITGQMERMDLAELGPPGNPTVYNTTYKYSNPSLKEYDVKAFTKYNSPMPDNLGLACVVDKTDILWYATAHGLTRFDGKTFANVNESNSPFTANTAVNTIAVDKDNNKWMYANRSVYMNNDKGWQIFDSTHMAISRPYHIVTNPSGEIFFPNAKGLLIFRGDKMRLIDKNTIFDMPSNNVYYAYFDSHERLWVGTMGGSIMIDKKQKVTVYNNTNTPLKDVCISGVTEDEQGNVYFALQSYKNLGGDNDEEGIAIMNADGTWKHFNDKNSGMPVNHVSSVFYDKFAHALWIGTHQAGLVRYDLKDGWEDYNNNNSNMPGFDVNQLTQDSKGNIYAATMNGLVRISKK